MKYGSLDFQVREPAHPLFGYFKNANAGIELQIAQEYLGQQAHTVYLAPLWKEILDTDLRVDAISQVQPYAFGRLAWDPTDDPEAIIKSWSHLTFGLHPQVTDIVVRIGLESWPAYLNYSSGDLGLPTLTDVTNNHFGPNVRAGDDNPYGIRTRSDSFSIGIPDEAGRAGHHPWRIEAEAMSYSGYKTAVLDPIESASNATALETIGNSTVAAASTKLDFEPGKYDIAVVYFDILAGTSQWEAYLNGKLLGKWVGNLESTLSRAATTEPDGGSKARITLHNQKCDYRKPCGNCVKADEQCYAASSTRPLQNLVTTQGPLQDRVLGPAEVAALEERISRIEQMTQQPGLRTHPSEPGNSQAHVQERPGLDATAASPSILADPSHLSRGTPAMALLAAFAAPISEIGSPSITVDARQRPCPQGDLEDMVDSATEETLFSIYNDKVQWRYPFLRLYQLRNRHERSSEPCTLFFISMIYSISLLLGRSGPNLFSGLRQEDFYSKAVTQYLAYVFKEPDQLIHIQAYLIIAMHAIYSPSTERIITITSAAMRYCVMAQLHCDAAEPAPVDVAARIQIQLRRRIFWCTHKLDRTVGGTYHLPMSIPDSQISVKMYANIDDIELDDRCNSAFPDEVQGVSRFTDVSAALHVVYCRQIQSEILNSTLHRDYSQHLDRNDGWRLRVLEKLDRWRSLWDRYADTPSQNLAGSDWINMMYSYSLSMLYQPTKTSVFYSAGTWTVKACMQACLIFRKFQKDTTVTDLWLGLIAQFKCGVSLLYTFFATPPQIRPAAYEHPDVAEAVRACSITLTLIAERWPEARCIRDTFDILAREVPLFEHALARTTPTGRRVRPEARKSLLSLLQQIEPIVVHRDTLRMIREIATDDFPFHDQAPQATVIDQPNSTSQAHSYESPSQQLDIPVDFFQPLTSSALQLDIAGSGLQSIGDSSIEFPAYFDLADYL
ncbi:hypothetical protein FVER53590_29960 [Fusarium verticillioides]|nr:hypothetical protein FVER53590_29960 [Fusarium verticillioides]